MKWSQLLCPERLNKPGQESENEELDLNPFERDYYTIVTSPYFRRLQRKTQVYVLDQNDYSRNRLTHSLEVSAIAEIMGKRVAKNIQERETDLPEHFSEDLSKVLRCAGLLHDMGNPPFGHSGEEYIRGFFRDNEEGLRKNLSEQMWLDFVNFEGNAQNVRIVTKLGGSSNPKDGSSRGMHLTSAVINSIIKYPCSSMVRKPKTGDEDKQKPEDEKELKSGDEGESKADNKGRPVRGKIGYYHSEEWIVTDMLPKKTGTKKGERLLRDPIMLLMEAADDIAYGTADVDDAVNKGLLSERQVEEVLKEVEFPPECDNLEKKLQYVRERSMVEAIATFDNHYPEIMSGDYEGELVDENHCKLSELKKLLTIIFPKRDQDAEVFINSKKKIYDILDRLIQVVTNPKPSFSEYLIKKNLDQFIEKAEDEVYYETKLRKYNKGNKDQETLYHQYMAVVDFVSGMTDSYVSIFYDELFSDSHAKKEMLEYKNGCLKKITHAYDFSSAKKALAELGYVDQWEDYEMATIFRSYFYNVNVREAYGANAYMRNLYRKNRSMLLDGFHEVLTSKEIERLDRELIEVDNA